MDIGKCFFAKEAPDIDIRGGLCFIRPNGSHCEVAVTPYTARKFAVRLLAMLNQWEADQRQPTVIPISLSAGS